ncbi:MAG: hypothetical protein US40_C0011G0011 [Candidatus Roizmanbacteria bacterium GW2011_GWC2_37_13]|uniref:EamA domain-containing protein n=1 Tax=Candidatus Roizmanbacteria bacterium GW2011_GWC2_37_13 TaxID=1618486 RepID=A0A0G0JAB1_9BACT|nr:MAG: hypothetical protein US38_C0007G0011 [Candidatus Roizmanbacteria bacterium GW2011_GWC1_37_12]KKQ25126.1 MAG: hypothetical protein US40_C0011G0011 [Candidatus Roizmanbacteria bacterium GW2011_GWC2_37_13]
MSWIFYSLLAVFVFSFVNLFDKFFVSKKFKSVYSFVFVLNVVYFIFYLAYFFVFWKTFVYSNSFLWAIASGFFYFFMWIFWFKALSGGEVSRSSAIFFTQPLFNSVLAVIFLDESLSTMKWLAVGMIVIGAIFSSIESKKTKSGFNTAYFFALLATIFASVGNTIVKHATVVLPALTVGSIGYFFTLPFYFIFLKDKGVSLEVKEKLTNLKELILIFFRGMLGFTAINLFMSAIGSGPVSLVSALNGGQPLVVLILSILASIFFPKLIKEEITEKSLAYKIVSVLLIVTGAVIISLF